jgi:hypothetical protein
MIPSVAAAALLGAMIGGDASVVTNVQMFSCPPGYVHRLPDLRCHWAGRFGHPGRFGNVFMPRHHYGPNRPGGPRPGGNKPGGGHHRSLEDDDGPARA